MRLGDIECDRNFALELSFRSHAANLTNLIWSQFRGVASSLRYTVSVVPIACSIEEVIRPEASRIVALMEHANGLSNLADRENKRNAVGDDHISLPWRAQQTVSVFVFPSGPLHTGIVLRNITQKFFQKLKTVNLVSHCMAPLWAFLLALTVFAHCGASFILPKFSQETA